MVNLVNIYLYTWRYLEHWMPIWINMVQLYFLEDTYLLLVISSGSVVNWILTWICPVHLIPAWIHLVYLTPAWIYMYGLHLVPAGICLAMSAWYIEDFLILFCTSQMVQLLNGYHDMCTISTLVIKYMLGNGDLWVPSALDTCWDILHVSGTIYSYLHKCPLYLAPACTNVHGTLWHLRDILVTHLGHLIPVRP
jgi:hypothetical protein